MVRNVKNLILRYFAVRSGACLRAHEMPPRFSLFLSEPYERGLCSLKGPKTNTIKKIARQKQHNYLNLN